MKDVTKLGNLKRFLQLERVKDRSFGVWNTSSGKDLNPGQSVTSKDSSARTPLNTPVILKDTKFGQSCIVRVFSFGNKFKEKVVRELQLLLM